MSPSTALLINLAVIAGAMAPLWLISVIKEDASIVDIFWGMGFVLVAWAGYALSPEGGSLLCVALITVWGVRLSGYLAWRNLGKGEDYRYRAMRKRIGPRFRWVSAYTVFGLQGLLIWIVSLPVQMIPFGPPGESSGELTAMTVIGIGFWAVGIFFETVGDVQLARFKSRPDSAGQVMDRGLWRYTRHPNYFGDFMVWWGIFLIAMATPAGLLAKGWTIVGPVIMSILLIRVSGAALLERSLRRRRPGYEEYISRTSAFFPWPPRRARD